MKCKKQMKGEENGVLNIFRGVSSAYWVTGGGDNLFFVASGVEGGASGYGSQYASANIIIAQQNP